MGLRDVVHRILGDPEALDDYRRALGELDAYGEHQKEQHPRGGYETPEYHCLNDRVAETAANIPRVNRRGGLLGG